MKRKCNVELLETLYRAGVSVDDIAPQVGLATGANVSAWASKMGLPLRNVAGQTAERDAAIYAESKEGVATNDLAEKYGISPRTAQVVILRGKRAEFGPQRVHKKPKGKPVVQVIAPQPVAKVKFSFAPAAIKRYEART